MFYPTYQVSTVIPTMDASNIQSQISTLLESITSAELSDKDQEAILHSLMNVQIALFRRGRSNSPPQKPPQVEVTAKQPKASLATLYNEMRIFHLRPPDKDSLLQILITYQVAKPHLVSKAARQHHIQDVVGKDPKRHTTMNLDLNAGETIEKLVDSFGPNICSVLCKKQLLPRLKKGLYAERIRFVKDFEKDHDSWVAYLRCLPDDGWSQELRNIGFNLSAHEGILGKSLSESTLFLPSHYIRW